MSEDAKMGGITPAVFTFNLGIQKIDRRPGIQLLFAVFQIG
jgi:hypothetical protein